MIGRICLRSDKPLSYTVVGTQHAQRTTRGDAQTPKSCHSSCTAIILAGHYTMCKPHSPALMSNTRSVMGFWLCKVPPSYPAVRFVLCEH